MHIIRLKLHDHEKPFLYVRDSTIILTRKNVKQSRKTTNLTVKPMRENNKTRQS